LNPTTNSSVQASTTDYEYPTSNGNVTIPNITGRGYQVFFASGLAGGIFFDNAYEPGWVGVDDSGIAFTNPNFTNNDTPCANLITYGGDQIAQPLAAYAISAKTSSSSTECKIYACLTNANPYSYQIYPTYNSSSVKIATAYLQITPTSSSSLLTPTQTPTQTPAPTPTPTIGGNISCFKEGSKILTDKGYKSIEDLRKGDMVKTLKHDFKPIEMIGKREITHIASEERNKNQLYKCSKTAYPEVFEDLVITGYHSILVDEFVSQEQREKVLEVLNIIYVTDAKYRLPACVDERASVYEVPGVYTIYHLALENDDYYKNYGIYANGLLVETCSKRYLKELSNMVLIE